MKEATAKNQSRVKNSVRNSFFSALSYVIKLLCQFATRAVFIRYFAKEYLGINGLFTNVLQVLSLAELGVGNAIVYSMYKPISENDTEKIKSLVRFYRNIYLVIAAVVTVLGLALIPALPYLINDAPNVDLNLNVVYALYLAQTVVGYFFAYRRALIFAYQRNDIESKVSLLAQVALCVSQIIAIILWHNFYAYIILLVVFNSLDALVVFVASYKMFPSIRGKAAKLDKADSKEIAKNTGALVCHRIGSAVVYSTDSIIISAYLGSALLGVYSNYTLVTNGFVTLVNLLVTAVKGSIGNFISTKTPEETYKVYKALNMLLMCFIGWISIGLVVCFQDFIRLYAGSEDYLLPIATVMIIIVNFYTTESRWLTIAFKDCAGLFWNDRYKALFEAGFNLVLDFLLVHFLGLNGVIIATIISTVTVPLWVEPFVLFKHYFKKPLRSYFIRYTVFTAISAAVCAATYWICYFIPFGIGWFILKFAICIIVPISLFIAVYARTPEFAYLKGVAVGLLKRKKKPLPIAVEEKSDIPCDNKSDADNASEKSDDEIKTETIGESQSVDSEEETDEPTEVEND